MRCLYTKPSSRNFQVFQNNVTIENEENTFHDGTKKNNFAKRNQSAVTCQKEDSKFYK